MNKILLESDLIKKEYHYELTDNDTNIRINNNVYADYYSDNFKELSVVFENNSKFIFNHVLLLNRDAHITFHLENNNILDYTIVILNSGINNLIIDANALGNNNKINIKLRVINHNKDSKVNIIVNGIIKAKTIDNELLEDLKGLVLNNDFIKISPNMLIDTNEVLANHLVTIGSFRSDELFYLKSKGLSEKLAKKLLLESFIKNNLNDNLKEKINLEVIKFE